MGMGVSRMVDEQAIGARVKNSIIGLIRGSGEITQAAVETVASTVQSAIKETGETGGAVGSVAAGPSRAPSTPSATSAGRQRRPRPIP